MTSSSKPTTPSGPQAQEAGEHYEYEVDRAYPFFVDGKHHVRVSYWRTVGDQGFLRHTNFCEVTHESDAERLSWLLISKRESTPPARVVSDSEIRRVIHELRTYNPPADPYNGKHIHGVWARQLEAALSTLQSGAEGRDVDALKAAIQKEINSVRPPNGMTEARQEYWKAGARAAIMAVNAALSSSEDHDPAMETWDIDDLRATAGKGDTALQPGQGEES